LEEEVRNIVARRGGADRIFLISGTYRNRYLDEVAASLGKTFEDVLIDNIGLGGANAVYHTMIESDVRTLMASSYQMIGSDGPTSSHPRGSGTFPRFWGRYVRDLGMFSRREGVYKTSQLAAEQFRLTEQGRGKLQPGFYADITVFDAASIVDSSTWDAPTLAPSGIEYVIVNGQLAVDRGAVTGVLAGRVLRLTDSQPRLDAHWRLY
jgi:N-acyl-D-amino-acid deacylase